MTEKTRILKHLPDQSCFVFGKVECWSGRCNPCLNRAFFGRIFFSYIRLVDPAKRSSGKEEELVTAIQCCVFSFFSRKWRLISSSFRARLRRDQGSSHRPKEGNHYWLLPFFLGVTHFLIILCTASRDNLEKIRMCVAGGENNYKEIVTAEQEVNQKAAPNNNFLKITLGGSYKS